MSIVAPTIESFSTASWFSVALPPRPPVFTARPSTPVKTALAVVEVQPASRRVHFEDDDENPFLDRPNSKTDGPSFSVARAYPKVISFEENDFKDNPLSGAQKSVVDDDTDTAYLNQHKEIAHRSCSALQFASYASVANPTNVQTDQDDLESFFWVVLYCTLRHTRHNAARDPESLDDAATRGPNLSSLLNVIFEPNPTIEDTEGAGFAKKVLHMTGRPLPPDFKVHGNAPLTSTIHELMKVFHDRFNFFGKTVPKRIKKNSRKLGINHADAEERYISSQLYETEYYERAHITHQKLLDIMKKGLADENWPLDDKTVDGLRKVLGARGVCDPPVE